MVGKIFWVDVSGWGCMKHYFGWVGVVDKIFWVGGCESW